MISQKLPHFYKKCKGCNAVLTGIALHTIQARFLRIYGVHATNNENVCSIELQYPCGSSIIINYFCSLNGIKFIDSYLDSLNVFFRIRGCDWAIMDVECMPNPRKGQLYDIAQRYSTYDGYSRHKYFAYDIETNKFKFMASKKFWKLQIAKEEEWMKGNKVGLKKKKTKAFLREIQNMAPIPG